jgi:hypothetical protein
MENIVITYRKKPVEIDAMRWDGTAAGATPIIDWILSNGGTARYHDNAAAPDCPGSHENGPFRFCDQKGCGWQENGPVIIIDTLEGAMAASPRDFVIRGVQGEFYPCKPDIFDATYERVTA